jgi:nicotinate-nucleotide adenylyltransferase
MLLVPGSGLSRAHRTIPPILPPVQRGILGGTFDPPHLAHLVAGESAYRDLGLDIVTFIPAGDPWQKAGRHVSAPEHRWHMTQLAVDSVDYFEADDREVRRDGWTFTIDTLESYPDDEDITLILGADSARGLSSWQRHEDILARARVAVMSRPGIDGAEVEAAVGSNLVWLDSPQIPVSGTMLRARAAAGRSLRFFVRETVWMYLEEHRLYAPD